MHCSLSVDSIIMAMSTISDFTYSKEIHGSMGKCVDLILFSFLKNIGICIPFMISANTFSACICFESLIFFHRQSGLMAYSPYGCKEQDVTDQLLLSFSLFHLLSEFYVVIYVNNTRRSHS